MNRDTPDSGVRGLYVIIDPQVTAGRPPEAIAEAALRGGAKVLQLRDKLREKGETLVLARSLKELCAERGAMLIINDHADLAAIVDADGLHVGQGDLPVAEARKVLQQRQVIGRSNHSREEMEDSLSQGADHLAFGAIYATSTKVTADTSRPVGPEGLQVARQMTDLPLVAIGGINEGNIEAVVRAGADAVCVTAAVGLADDPEDAARRLVQRIEGAGGRI
jgi:thiamine-phosphate diphosphorylase